MRFSALRCVYLCLTVCCLWPVTGRATDEPTNSNTDTVAAASHRTIARCGAGWLEEIGGYPVLHLKGTPYEMGYQHGALLRESVRQNMHTLMVEKAGAATLVEVGPLKLKPRLAIDMIVAMQEPHLPQWFHQELAGLSAGSGLSEGDLRAANFIPELFHCSGFALMGTATVDGSLYHGRVLDYAIDWGLQDHAVLIVAEPEGKVPWVNVTYAGFIGSVTGMNAEHISIGEMGGGGLGHWGGRPMALIVRDALEQSHSLDEAIAVFRDGPRTCQYYYVLADGAAKQAVGMEASWNVFELVPAGTAHPLLPTAVSDCVLMSAGDRYTELVKRAQAGHGGFTAREALRLMDRPVAMKSNLHNVLFEPGVTRLHIANATSDKRPVAEQNYATFDLQELLAAQPEESAPELPLVQTTHDR